MRKILPSCAVTKIRSTFPSQQYCGFKDLQKYNKRATSLTWETSLNQWIHLSEVMIIYIIKLPRWFRKRIFKFRECIFAILLLSPIVKTCSPSIWTNVNHLHPGMLLPSLVEIWPCFCRKVFNFRVFVIISPWKKAGSFILINFIKGCFVLSLVEIGPVVLEKSFKFRQCIFTISLEKGKALHLNDLDFLSAKNDFCQVWLKLAQWFRRRRFLKFVNVYSQFR